MRYIVFPPLGLELTLRAAQDDLVVFGLNVSLEAGLLGGLIITLTAGISHPLVLASFMLEETLPPCCLELALVTRILDSFVSSADMPLEVVRS